MVSLRRRLLFSLVTNQELERQVRRLPALEQRAWAAARRYVAGHTAADAIAVASRLRADGIDATLDFFGESVTDPAVADRVTADYVRLAGALAEVDGAWLAIDLSHIGLDASVEDCRRRLATIAGALPKGRRIQVGAEESTRADAVLAVIEPLARDGAPIMVTLQANLRRSTQDAARLAESGIPARLVKGAYVERPESAHPWGEQTDVAFLHLAHELSSSGAEFSIATHDPVLREALLLALGPLPVEMLLGIREDDAHDLARRGIPIRCYIPYGQDWFRYWMRRLAESQGTR